MPCAVKKVRQRRSRTRCPDCQESKLRRMRNMGSIRHRSYYYSATNRSPGTGERGNRLFARLFPGAILATVAPVPDPGAVLVPIMAQSLAWPMVPRPE